MERFTNSPPVSSDFEFKYIPKKEFERLVTRVEQERKLKKKGVWGSFCSVNGFDEDKESPDFTKKTKKNDERSLKAWKVLTDDDIQSVIHSIDKQKIIQRLPSSQAPFLAPPKRRSVAELEMFEKGEEEEEQGEGREKFQSSCGEDSSDESSVHIEETVFITQQTSDAKIQVANQTNYNDENDNETASACSTIDGGEESLQSEMLKLCNEIGNANGKVLSSAASSVDLTYQEAKDLKNIVDKTEEKIVCEKYKKFIDKKFDFLNEKCQNFYSDAFDEDEEGKTQAQTLPVVELRQNINETRKVTSDDELSYDNNVSIPQLQNQIRKSGREHEKSTVKKKRNDDVFPGDAGVRKAREVGKLKRDVNEKSQVDVTTLNIKKDEKSHQLNHDRDPRDAKAPLRTNVMLILGKITQFQEKICQYLDYLREIIQDPPEIEDMIDLKKRQKRAIEFSNRFARNHLYQIGRIAEEIRVMSDNPSDIAEKVNFLFQVIMQAVQTYLKNVEMFIYNNYPDKLVVLIDFIINTMKICLDRMVFDKRDLVIQKIMRKCVDMKKYLELNQQSLAKFASIQEKRRMSLASRNSFAFENSCGSKLSMYGESSSKKKPRHKRQPPQSPYDIAKPKNFNKNEVKSRVASSRNQTQAKPQVNNPPRVRRSSSTISTAVQRMKSSESVEDMKMISEKPLEDSEAGSHQAVVEKIKELELNELMESINKEKFQEMLEPFLVELMKKLQPEVKKTEDEEVSEKVKKLKASSRVTSDISVKKTENLEHTEKPNVQDRVDRIADNVQYLYVSSNEDLMRNENFESKSLKRDAKSSGDHLPDVSNCSESKMKVVAMKSKPVEKSPINMKKLKEHALKDRLNYIEKMSSNPLYCNEACDEPWKMFAEISDKILDKMLNEVLGEFDFGEKLFINKFLQHELQC